MMYEGGETDQAGMDLRELDYGVCVLTELCQLRISTPHTHTLNMN